MALKTAVLYIVTKFKENDKKVIKGETMSETIINGIDVSECEYINCCSEEAKCIILQDDICSNSHYCKSEPDCYFKQLKRLQEENKELRQARKNSPDIQEPYVYLYRQIKKQCHKLEEENKELKKQLTEDKILDEEIQSLSREDKYKSALEEIKNITERLITEQSEYHSCYYKDECGDNCTPKKQSKVEYCCYENADKILTIIIEVLDDRN